MKPRISILGSRGGWASALDSALLVVMWGALFGAVQRMAICEAEQLRLDVYLNYLKPLECSTVS